MFSEEKLAIKVFMDSGTTATDKFRARLRFKQYDVILTKEQKFLAKIKSSFEEQNMQAQKSTLG